MTPGCRNITVSVTDLGGSESAFLFGILFHDRVSIAENDAFCEAEL